MMELLVAAALKGSLLLAAAWIATAMLRRSSADVRHRIWLGALLGIALLLIPLRMPQAAQVEVPYTLVITAAASAPVATAFRWDWVWEVGFAFVLARFASTLTGLWLGLDRLVKLAHQALDRLARRFVAWGIAVEHQGALGFALAVHQGDFEFASRLAIISHFNFWFIRCSWYCACFLCHFFCFFL